MTRRFENALTTLLVVCVIALTVSAVRGGEGATASATATRRPVGGWTELAKSGAVLGDSSAAIRIVEFSDFECPACATMRTTLAELRARYPRDVAVVYRHFPLESIHPTARAAAVASECAAEQGRFASYHDALFARQTQIRRADWLSFAREAGVPDTARFRACLSSDGPAARVSEDLAAGQAIGVDATPTFVVDGEIATAGVGPTDLEKWVSETLCERTRGRLRCWLSRAL